MRKQSEFENRIHRRYVFTYELQNLLIIELDKFIQERGDLDGGYFF